MRFFYIILALFTFTCTQAVVPRFKQLTVKEGFEHQLILNIVQDQQGLMWFGTVNGLASFNGYITQSFSLNNNTGGPSPDVITALAVDKHQSLWIGTLNSGLFKYKEGLISPIKDENGALLEHITSLAVSSDKELLVGTANGFYYLPDILLDRPKVSLGLAIENTKTALYPLKENKILASVDEKLYVLQTEDTTGSILHSLKQVVIDAKINNIHVDSEETIWLASNQGVFTSRDAAQSFIRFMPEQIHTRVTAITSSSTDVWFGTMFDGLFQLNKGSNQLSNYKNKPNNDVTLSDNSITSLFIDRNNTLWAGTFSNGLSYLYLPTLAFGFESSTENSIYCSSDQTYKDVFQDEHNNLWITSNSELIKYNAATEVCQTIKAPHNILAVEKKNKNNLWVLTTQGLFVLNKKKQQLQPAIGSPPHSAKFIIQQADSYYLVGTEKGLYAYDTSSQRSKEVKLIDGSSLLSEFNHFAQNSHGESFFATQTGLFSLANGHLQHHHLGENIPEKAEILTLLVDSHERLWVGTFQHGLYLFNSTSNSLKTKDRGDHILKDVTVNSLLEDNDGLIWSGTDSGLIRYDSSAKIKHRFVYKDGLQGDFFQINSAFKSDSGQLLFGGRGGLNMFDPNDIRLSHNKPEVQLTELMHFNKPVIFGEKNNEIHINKPIKYLDELVLTHKNYIVGFEFAAMDYADSHRNQYAYKLDGFNQKWIHVDASNRRATFTNLSPGNYVFKVKASNKDGIWSQDERQLKIKVHPAPWLSWWAITAYLLSAIMLIYIYINSRIKRSEQQALNLKHEVLERTQEVNQQKKTLEVLLQRKNELFANVSHEFRTPLTLILGPLEQLIKERTNYKNNQYQSLQLIKRNTIRLKTLVEQLLQLAQINQEVKLEKKPVDVNSTIKLLVSSFCSVAQQKNLSLQLLKNEPAVALLSPNALETIIGNFISNALKYTQSGGSIRIESTTRAQYIDISVTDTGCGLDTSDQSVIFKRFSRLNKHQHIEGSGIGLAVAKEVAEANHASITVQSEIGKGATFVLRMRRYAESSDVLTEQTGLAEQLAASTAIETTTEKTVISSVPQSSDFKITILVIEDNIDMQIHIGQVLEKDYSCRFASDGAEGIAMALEIIPDLIISDVMMPHVDGYEVTRSIRNDNRTCHIPLIMLTALEGKEYRIKGLKEHIDVYISKPFAADELLAQIENTLTIRNILKNKAHFQLQSGASLSELGLPLKDQQFIDKLNLTISEHYTDPLLDRPKLANFMAVSERQLHRKTTALINQSAMDLLRTHRLEQSKIMLQDGYQVNLVGDACGFNSVSYFSRCFKAHYNMSPKQYQQSSHN